MSASDLEDTFAGSKYIARRRARLAMRAKQAAERRSRSVGYVATHKGDMGPPRVLGAPLPLVTIREDPDFVCDPLSNRPGFAKAIEALESNDCGTLVVFSVQCLGSNIFDVAKTICGLFEDRDVIVRSARGPDLDTSTAQGRLDLIIQAGRPA